LGALYTYVRTAFGFSPDFSAESVQVRRASLVHHTPPLVAFTLAAAIAAFLTNDLLRMPLQVPDSLTLILDAAQSPSPWATFTNYLNNAGYFRPFFYLQNKVLFDVSNGHVALTYRAYHAASVAVALFLFVRALRVRSRSDLAAVPLALCVFAGIHTFLSLVKEIYPVNHELEITIAVLAAVNLAQARPRSVVDLLWIATLILAVSTLETGLLVWVVLATAWLTGMPGASRRTMVVATTLVAGYLGYRLLVATPPADFERSSGFLLQRLDPPELEALFGERMWLYRGYNVVSSLLTVLFSEPRHGVWVFFRDLAADRVRPSTWINLTASLTATATIGWYIAHRWRAGARWPATQRDHLVAIFAGVLVANATISFAYAKDDILNPAGSCYAIAVYVAASQLIQRWQREPPRALVAVLVLTLAVAGSGAWAVRAFGVHQVLLEQAFVQRNDWADLETQWERERKWNDYAASRALVRQLRHEVLATPVPNPRSTPRWIRQVTDAEY
jgi:hypothetical protein